MILGIGWRKFERLGKGPFGLGKITLVFEAQTFFIMSLVLVVGMRNGRRGEKEDERKKDTIKNRGNFPHRPAAPQAGLWKSDAPAKDPGDFLHNRS